MNIQISGFFSFTIHLLFVFRFLEFLQEGWAINTDTHKKNLSELVLWLGSAYFEKQAAPTCIFHSQGCNPAVKKQEKKQALMPASFVPIQICPRCQRAKNFPPGPTPLAIIGNLLNPSLDKRDLVTHMHTNLITSGLVHFHDVNFLHLRKLRNCLQSV